MPEQKNKLRDYYQKLMRAFKMEQGTQKDQPFSAVELKKKLDERKRRNRQSMED